MYIYEARSEYLIKHRSATVIFSRKRFSESTFAQECQHGRKSMEASLGANA